MRLTVLSLAYPFAPVTEDPAGGAEQILAHLDRALVAAGHRSIVIAQAGSRTAGEIVPIPAVPGPIDDPARARTHAAVRAATDAVLAREPVHLVHAHGLDFDRYLPPPGPPLLVTLHLPLSWYDPPALRPARPDTHLLPVSAAQAATAPPGVALLAPISNGVDVDSFPELAKRGFALCLGRIAPEKGAADALDAARIAEMPLLVAGETFAYPEHQAYFAQQVAPRLDRPRRFIGPVHGAAKRRLLARARALLLPSRAPETSSLVAMEAAAAGTPVIAYPSGALPSIVEHGATGLLADGVEAMAAALRQVDGIRPETCRATANTRFRLEPMIAAYLALYRVLASARSSASSRT